MTRKEAISILERSNSLLSGRIKELCNAAVDITVGDAKANAYRVLSYCEQEYEAVCIAISDLREREEYEIQRHLKHFDVKEPRPVNRTESDTVKGGKIDRVNPWISVEDRLPVWKPASSR